MDILLRFRTYRVALAADIEKAFLTVSMAKHDRDMLQFLWTDDVDSDPPTIHDLRFTRVVFSVSSSPFLLNTTIDHHLKKYLASPPDFIKTLQRSIYVDDVVTAADTEDEAYQACAVAKSSMRDGRFNLQKFTTNCRSLQAKINGEVEDATKGNEEEISFWLGASGRGLGEAFL